MTAMPAEQVGRYSCPACDRRFTSLSEKKRHLRGVHLKPEKVK